MSGTPVPRSLLIVACLVVVQDLAFFAVISPLLPFYVDELGLSETEAGVLTASYAAGTLLAGLPAGFLAARAGPRATVIAGLLLFGASGLVFGLADSIVLLDASRFTQGVASAMSWAGAFAWVLSWDSGERRGQLIGTMLGVAIAGALLGPAIGALAEVVGTEYVFASVLAGSIILAVLAARLPDAKDAARSTASQVFAALRGRSVLVAGAMLAVPSALFGVVGVLFPLEIDELGGGAVVIAASFTGGAALEAILSPLVGRYTDRRPWTTPYLAGLLICAAGVAAIAASELLGVVVAAVVVVSIGSGLCFAPVTRAVSDASEARGLHQGIASGVTNVCWAGGEVAGSLSAGALADAQGLAAAFTASAVFLVVATAVAWRVAPGPSRAASV